MRKNYTKLEKEIAEKKLKLAEVKELKKKL